MSIRIGNTVYIDDMKPIEVEPRVAAAFERLSFDWDVSKDTLDDLIKNKPGGVVRVKRLAAR